MAVAGSARTGARMVLGRPYMGDPGDASSVGMGSNFCVVLPIRCNARPLSARPALAAARETRCAASSRDLDSGGPMIRSAMLIASAVAALGFGAGVAHADPPPPSPTHRRLRRPPRGRATRIPRCHAGRQSAWFRSRTFSSRYARHRDSSRERPGRFSCALRPCSSPSGSRLALASRTPTHPPGPMADQPCTPSATRSSAMRGVDQISGGQQLGNQRPRLGHAHAVGPTLPGSVMSATSARLYVLALMRASG